MSKEEYPKGIPTTIFHPVGSEEYKKVEKLDKEIKKEWGMPYEW